MYPASPALLRLDIQAEGIGCDRIKTHMDVLIAIRSKWISCLHWDPRAIDTGIKGPPRWEAALADSRVIKPVDPNRAKFDGLGECVLKPLCGALMWPVVVEGMVVII